jgi:hypothetical protein
MVGGSRGKEDGLSVSSTSLKVGLSSTEEIVVGNQKQTAPALVSS